MLACAHTAVERAAAASTHAHAHAHAHTRRSAAVMHILLFYCAPRQKGRREKERKKSYCKPLTETHMCNWTVKAGRKEEKIMQCVRGNEDARLGMGWARDVAYSSVCDSAVMWTYYMDTVHGPSARTAKPRERCVTQSPRWAASRAPSIYDVKCNAVTCKCFTLHTQFLLLAPPLRPINHCTTPIPSVRPIIRHRQVSLRVLFLFFFVDSE